MKKAFDQTVRDLKRGVNKKVLKVPSIEQKVLDATSNEPWGPHGSLLADIAQATRNYHEYQMIMSVIWKRINDTGKNWRHVYKALTVLEYLVAHGSERVIDEIREHAYQISTLSDFQYIDSSGKDQGNNVRKKSQSLVVLVNDKERIQEVRQKAAANREKYRNTPMGSMYRPGSGSSPGGYGDRYDDDRYESRYGNRDDDRNGYGREREWGSRDDDRYGRYGDSYGREGDRYSRDSEDRYGRDGYRDDDYRDGSRSADRERDRGSEDDGQYSSRGSGARADDHSQDGSSIGKRLDRKFSEQNLDAPPSYEEAVGPARSPTYSERDGESSVAQAPKASSPGSATPRHTATAAAPPLAPASPTTSVSPSAPASAQPTAQPSNNEVDRFDEFDPRGSFSAAPTASNGAAPAAANVEMDLLGSLSESFSSNSLALTVQPSVTADTSASGDFNSGATFAAASSGSTITNQPFDDPFGDGPFKAFPTTDSAPFQAQTAPSTNSFDTNPVPQKAATPEFGGPFHDASQNMPSGPSPMQPPTNTPFAQQELPNPNQDVDILADILPPSAPSSVVTTQTGYAVPPNQSHSFPPQTNQSPPQNSFQVQTGQPAGFPTQPGQHAGFPTQPGQPAGFPTQPGQPAGFPTQPGQPAGFPTQPGQPAGFPTQPGQPAGFPTQPGQPAGFPTQPGQPAGFPTQPGQPAGFPTQPGQPAGFPTQLGQPSLQANYPMQSGESVPQTGFVGQTLALTYPIQGGQAPQMGFNSQGTPPQQNPNFYGAYQSQPVSTGGAGPYLGSGGPTMQHNFLSQSSSAARPSSLMAQPTSTMPTSTVSSTTVPQPTQDKFQTKSTVWTDTLSRGLVNLNISGSKTNPLADIGVDFDAINRKEKRMEKPTTATVTSTVTMGKAMGSGSGMGRAGASALRPSPNAMVGSGQGMGMGMGGYGASQPMGRGVGMGMNMGMGQGNMGMGQGNMGMGQGNMGMGQGNMGMGMNMGMGQGMQMPQQGGFPPGSTMPGGAGAYNHMMGAGNYGQQPYGGGYR